MKFRRSHESSVCLYTSTRVKYSSNFVCDLSIFTHVTCGQFLFLLFFLLFLFFTLFYFFFIFCYFLLSTRCLYFSSTSYTLATHTHWYSGVSPWRLVVGHTFFLHIPVAVRDQRFRGEINRLIYTTPLMLVNLLLFYPKILKTDDRQKIMKFNFVHLKALLIDAFN